MSIIHLFHIYYSVVHFSSRLFFILREGALKNILLLRGAAALKRLRTTGLADIRVKARPPHYGPNANEHGSGDKNRYKFLRLDVITNANKWYEKYKTICMRSICDSDRVNEMVVNFRRESSTFVCAFDGNSLFVVLFFCF